MRVPEGPVQSGPQEPFDGSSSVKSGCKRLTLHKSTGRPFHVHTTSVHVPLLPLTRDLSSNMVFRKLIFIENVVVRRERE